MSELAETTINLIYAGSEYSGTLNKRRPARVDPIQEGINYAKESQRIEGFYFFSRAYTEAEGKKSYAAGTQYSPTYWIGKVYDRNGLMEEAKKMQGQGMKNADEIIAPLLQKMQQDKTTHLVISRRGIIHPIKTKREIVLDPDKGFKQVYPLPRMTNLVNSAER